MSEFKATMQLRRVQRTIKTPLGKGLFRVEQVKVLQQYFEEYGYDENGAGEMVEFKYGSGEWRDIPLVLEED